MKRGAEEVAEGRSSCPRCGRPLGHCYCPLITPTLTRTRVTILQHPREAKVPLGTLRMVELSLPDALVRRGVDFRDDPQVAQLCAERPPPVLLFPGEGARDVRSLERGEAEALIAIDGTWPQAKQVLRRNPALAALPRVQLPVGAPSAYEIRPQPAAGCVSTLEALARALDALEGSGARYQELMLRPLRGLVAGQLRVSAERGNYRRRRPRVRDPKPPPTDSLASLRRLRERLVCVHVEANAWPARHPQRPAPQLLEWRALRLSTGERLEVTCRPRGPLGPLTAQHLGRSAEDLLAGEDLEELHARWERFRRPGEALACWGTFGVGLALEEGLPLPAERVDGRPPSAAPRAPAQGRQPGSSRGSPRPDSAAGEEGAR